MSDLKSFDVEIDVNDERIEKPAKAWLNWWKAVYAPRDRFGPHIDNDGNVVPLGHLLRDNTPKPSREIAEQKALVEIARITAKDGGCYWEWIGAFPEGTRP